jgi:CubicO group peptidase (beta-lactamase class C family)
LRFAARFVAKIFCKVLVRVRMMLVRYRKGYHPYRIPFLYLAKANTGLQMKIHFSASTMLSASMLALVLYAAPSYSNPQAAPYDAAAIEAKIKLIEKSLAPAFITNKTKRWTIQERMKHYAVPGVSIALINNGKVEWVRAYGVRNVQTKEPVTSDTLFQAASISKPVSALGAMLLVEQGKLALEENVNEKLTSWKLPENSFTQKTPVTLRALLTHTAGTTVHGFRGYSVGEAVPTVPQILDGAKPANSDPVRVDTMPRTQWRYSGGGTTIVQQLVTDVARQPFADYMRERVLVPAGMTRSAYDQPLSKGRAANAASGHIKGEPLAGQWHVYPELAAAGLWTTPRDLATFAIEVQRAASGGANTWLTQATAKQMVSESPPVSGRNRPWAIGFGLDTARGNPRFTHGGSNEGFQCNLVAYVSDGNGLVVMTNGDSGSPLIEEIERAAAFVYGWKELGPPIHTLVALTPAALDAFVGEYEGSDGAAISILRDGEQLAGRAAGMGWDKLHATGAKRFIAEGSQLTVEFTTDANGKSDALSLTTHEGTIRAPRRDGKAFQFATVPIFLRGSMNNWRTANVMQTQGNIAGSTVYATEIELDRGEYEFKFGSEDFNAVDIGGVAANAPAVVGKTSTLALVGSNIKLNIDKKARYTFVLDVKNPLAPTVMIAMK